MKTKRVLGILGFGDIGHRLFARLQYDFDCVAISRTPKPEAPCWRQADATQRENLAVAISDLDLLVVTLTPAERSDTGYRAAYVDTMANVTDICQTLRSPPLIFFVSSTAVFHQDNGEQVDEHSSCLPHRFNGQRLLEAEQLLAGSGLPYCIVRYSGIYGPGRHRLIEQVRKQVHSTDAPNGWTNRIHSEDCAGVLAHLIQLDNEQRANLYIATDDCPAPSLEVKHYIARTLGLGDAAETTPVSGGKRCYNGALKASGYRFLFPSYREGYAAVIDDLYNSSD